MFDIELLKVRALSFLYEAAGMILFTVTGVLASGEFSQLVFSHFGETLTASTIMLAVLGIVKHLRNLALLKNWENRIGGEYSEKPTII